MTDLLELIDVSRMLREGVQEPPYHLDDLIVEQSITIVTAAPKDFKTWLALSWSISLATGKPFAGLKVTPPPTGGHRILFLEAENWRQIPTRFQKLCLGYQVDPQEVLKQVFFYKPRRRPRLEQKEDAADLRNRAKGEGITSLFIDSFTRIHGLDENKNKDMAALSDIAFIPLRDEAGCDVTILDHTPKAFGGRQRSGIEQVRGAGDKVAAADCHIDVDVHRKGGQNAIEINVVANRLRTERAEPLYVDLRPTPNGGLVFQECGAPGWIGKGRSDETFKEIVQFLNGLERTNPGIKHKDAKAAATERGFKKTTFDKAWKWRKDKEAEVIIGPWEDSPESPESPTDHSD